MAAAQCSLLELFTQATSWCYSDGQNREENEWMCLWVADADDKSSSLLHPNVET